MPPNTKIYTSRIDSRRGRRCCSNFTRGASAKARMAAMETKMSERATWDAAHKTTAASPIQASMTRGIASGRNHCAPELKSNRQVTGREPFTCASAIDACDDEREIVLSRLLKCSDWPHFGQKVAISGQFAPQCIQNMIISPVPNILNNLNILR